MAHDRLLNVSSNEKACALTARRTSTGRVERMKHTAGFGLAQANGRGVYVTDLDGKEYLDCRCAGGIFNLGHRPPETLGLLKEALDHYDLGDWMLLSGIRARASDTLCKYTPAGLDHVQLAVTGSEAIEVACKLGRGTTGRSKIVTMEHAYHGFAGFALAAAPQSMRANYGPLVPEIYSVPHGDLKAAEEAIDDDTAVVLLEVVQGSAGVILPPDGYLSGLRKICDSKGALLVFDEVQAGMGRTGRLFSFEHWGVTPDMLVVAKAIGGACYPVSACFYNERAYRYACDEPLHHPSTFSGSELGCIVAEKSIELLSDTVLLENVQLRGEQLAACYKQLVADYPEFFTGYRHLGLFTGIDARDAATGEALRHACVRNGLIAFTAPYRPQCLQVWPPLIITETETEELTKRLSHAAREIVHAGNAN